MTKTILRIFLALLFTSVIGVRLNAQKKEKPMEHQVFHRTVKVDGLSVFYREAGPEDAPVILLLLALLLAVYGRKRQTAIPSLP